MKKGSAYMNVWMYAIREFEDAIDDCTSCTSNCNSFSINSGSVHAWDEGVAFYTGSLEGTADGGSSAGKLLYRLAEKRCANFGTCGECGDEACGTAMVNLELFQLGVAKCVDSEWLIEVTLLLMSLPRRGEPSTGR